MGALTTAPDGPLQAADTGALQKYPRWVEIRSGAAQDSDRQDPALQAQGPRTSSMVISQFIRGERPPDACYSISLATGFAGGDASHLYRDPRLMGHIYIAPYAGCWSRP